MTTKHSTAAEIIEAMKAAAAKAAAAKAAAEKEAAAIARETDWAVISPASRGQYQALSADGTWINTHADGVVAAFRNPSEAQQVADYVGEDARVIALSRLLVEDGARYFTARR